MKAVFVINSENLIPKFYSPAEIILIFYGICWGGDTIPGKVFCSLCTETRNLFLWYDSYQVKYG